jgi:hypothetical protein
MIDLNKKYKTRSGLDAEVLRTDLKGFGNYPVLVLVTNTDGSQDVFQCMKTGKYNKDRDTHELDLIEVKKKQVFYLNVNQDYRSGLFRTKSEAERHSSDNRIACIYVEFEEGQGL